jgi:hypothetical protein
MAGTRPVSGVGRRSDGLRARFARIPGETPKTVLRLPLYLPAVLNSFGWSESFSHVEYDTIRAGQFSQPAQGPATARQLRVLDDVETLTVEWNPVWLVENAQNPEQVRAALFAIGRSRKPVELLVSLGLGGPTLLRLNVTMRSIQAQLRSGEPDSIYYALRISEWRSAKTQRRGATPGGDKLPTTHRLTATDTLHSLSMHYYHSANGANDIARANGITHFGYKTPLVKYKRFKVGSKIKIPRLSSAVGKVKGTSKILGG